ncbi:hypothetical protein MPDQ_000472 [Monascus purpureus]|uniref:Uncharacterized protein n=1 Tax=Monascus purpureus TaxID=5098 RepID=A0A507QTS4_MONPU|nr:hypothetical protein MPDQ_000472 [Monascus purpureus]
MAEEEPYNVLQDIWEDMAEEEQEEIISQLHRYREELHSVKGDFIGSIGKLSCKDPPFMSELDSFGLYADEVEFHERSFRQWGLQRGSMSLSNSGVCVGAAMA